MSPQQENKIPISFLSNYNNKLKQTRTNPGTKSYPAYPSLGYRFRKDPNWFWFPKLFKIPMRVKIYTAGIKNRDPGQTQCEYIDINKCWPKELLQIGYYDNEYFTDAK